MTITFHFALAHMLRPR